MGRDASRRREARPVEELVRRVSRKWFTIRVAVVLPLSGQFRNGEASTLQEEMYSCNVACFPFWN
jgi:hypothetical protein